MIKLAKINVINILNKEQCNLTHKRTPYMYINLEIDYLVEYTTDMTINSNDSIRFYDIEISKTNYDFITSGMMFEINTILIDISNKFYEFAKPYTNPVITPLTDDIFLLQNVDSIRVLNYPDESILLNDKFELEDTGSTKEKEAHEIEKKIIRKNVYFLKTLKKSDSFIDELNDIVETDNLYYDIYDVNGFFSCITNDKDFYFYIDMGDHSNNKLPIVKKPFCVLLSHFHDDHYNQLLQGGIIAKYFIVSYGGSVLYNGKQLFSSTEIRFLDQNINRIQLVFTGHVIGYRKKSKLVPYGLTKRLNLYLPYYLKPNDRNLESICLEAIGKTNTVFYPGDTMHYMYDPYLKSFNYFIASHHGGKVGKINFRLFHFDNIIVNTFYRNIHVFNGINQPIYNSHTSNLIIGNSNNGSLITRIKL